MSVLGILLLLVLVCLARVLQFCAYKEGYYAGRRDEMISRPMPFEPKWITKGLEETHCGGGLEQDPAPLTHPVKKP